jgi:serine/threonine protein kinase
MALDPQHAKSIFLAALDRTGTERVAFLDEACPGDSELRRRVDRLLEAHDRPDSLPEASAVAHPTEKMAREERRSPFSASPERPGTVIGAYKLLQLLGEGGMGAVYMAEQQEPVRRMVALKVIKPGMDTSQVIARFEAERQALALMDHPNIARVLDAGATASGRPYFVMELVKGVPITEFCDKNHLTPEARLKLFLDVCHAIQHAHHKGIIHRDVKPSNVMVTLHDGVPVVKVIDFGVAKATAQRLTEKTLFTAYGQMIGTPAYISPEQAEMSGLDIDTRSDVYSLGVLLYELMTGTTPLESRRLREAGYAEIQRLIREEEAPRPSNRLSSLGGSATVLAGNRGLDVRRLVQFLAGDLDWVVMKALEKDRNRRYDTPGSFAEDIERYLRREAILARPPSAAYRLRKFVQRNRAAVLTAAAVAAALLAGTAVATWQAVVATRANKDAVTAAAAEKEAKQAAEEREAETKAVLEFVENKVFAAARPKDQAGGLGRNVPLRQAIEAALLSVKEQFTNQPLIEARLRMTLGNSFSYLGEAKAALEQFQVARGLYTNHRGPDHPDTLKSMDALAASYADLGRHAEALQLRQHTLALREAKLGLDHPDTLASLSELAKSYNALARHSEALKLREEILARRKTKFGPDHPDTLASMSDLASSYYFLDRQAEALKLREETLARREVQLGPDHPDTLRSMYDVALSYLALDRDAEALKLFEETLVRREAALGRDHPDTLWTMWAVATSYAGLGQHAEALRCFQQTLGLREVKLGPDHPDTLWTVWGMARSLVALGRGAEAVPIIDDCVKRAAGQIAYPRLIPGVLDVRLRHFQKIRDAAGCRQTAEMWEKHDRTDAASLYNAACMRAVTAAVLKQDPKTLGGDANRLANEQADRAMTRLKKAVAAGFKDAAHAAKDRDLDALRDRADFRKLLESLPRASLPRAKEIPFPPDVGK